MIRYDFSACIGAEIAETGPLVKRHDTGVTLAVHLVTCKKTSPWRTEKVPYIIPEGSKALFHVKKPDNTTVKTDMGVSIEGKSTVICEGIVQAFTAAGICNAEIVLYAPDGKRLTTATFTYAVTQECVCDTDTPSADYLDILSAEIKAVKDAAQTANESADKAIGLCANPPKLSEALTWLVWDANAEGYVDTGISGIGPPGADGKDGADIFVRIDCTMADDGTATVSKTYEEIQGIIDSGKIPYLRTEYYGSTSCAYFDENGLHQDSQTGNTAISFSCDGILVLVWSDGTVEIEFRRLLNSDDLVQEATNFATPDVPPSALAVAKYVGLQIGDISTALGKKLSKTLLWENASPTSGFTSQGITVDLTGYDEIEVEFTSPKNGTVGADLRRRETLSLCAIDTDSDVLCASYVQAIYAPSEIYSRAFRINKARSVIAFFLAVKSSASITTGTTAPAYLVPYKIYGIKGVTV